MPKPPGQPVVVDCTIELREVQPRVWRRLLVPGSVRLDRLHRTFQAAMGWEDCHLHAFEIGGERYGMQFDEYPDGELQEKDFTVVTAIGSNERFTYEYDFGDSWDHEVTVHRVWRMPKGLKFAVCLDGANACPPEDVGGSWGYEHLLAVLADPAHEEHEHLSEWVGRPVDATAFDLALVNAYLQAARWRVARKPWRRKLLSDSGYLDTVSAWVPPPFHRSSRSCSATATPAGMGCRIGSSET